MNYKKSEVKGACRAQFRGVWAAITPPFTADGVKIVAEEVKGKCKVNAHAAHQSAH
jgi:hypothetical protein